MRGAREHNLRDVSVAIPRDRLVVVTGVSGSGKTSLALDTVHNEGYRRFVDTLGTYARQFAGTVPRPDVDAVDGVSPSVAITERAFGRAGRSTVGTASDVFHSMRLLWARIGRRPRGASGRLEPADFSFNLPRGACPACTGVGRRVQLDIERLIPDPTRTLAEGAFATWAGTAAQLAGRLGIDVHTPWALLPVSERELFLHGDGTDTNVFSKEPGFMGVVPYLERRYLTTQSPASREKLRTLMRTATCSACAGARLGPEARAVTVAGLGIHELNAMTVAAARRWTLRRKPRGRDAAVGTRILAELARRLTFLDEVGLGYLGLDREITTLSAGEAQRVRLASVLGTGLVDVTYVLDEPSRGLHARDIARLLCALERLRDAGNTVLVVEHSEQFIRAADQVIDLGPGAGADGGRVVAQGSAAALMANAASVTGAALRAGPQHMGSRRRPAGTLRVVGARYRNLAEIDVAIPLGVLCAVTGVSGSGKSTLVRDVLFAALTGDTAAAGRCAGLEGAEHVADVVLVDQQPIGATARSTVATAAGIFDGVRRLFARLPEARARGYGAARFSFNAKGGRCEACAGMGELRVDMHWLPDVTVTCEACAGSRYGQETLEVRLDNRSIADVLALSVDEALTFLGDIRALARPLSALRAVGLGYLRLGQAAPTLSGGEAQRVKLAAVLGQEARAGRVCVLDEPTAGLHMCDVERLLGILGTLVDQGATVIVVEHDLDVIAAADHVIDLGPAGGEDGGRVVAQGTPEQVARCAESVTGRWLSRRLAGTAAAA